MRVDLELYREEIQISSQPQVRLSAIDVSPEHPQLTFVFLHGFAGRAAQWQNQLRTFSDANRCLAPDLRGHGQSDKPDSAYTVEELAGDIDAVLDRLGVNTPVILLGHSFGGALAAEYAVRRPERVAQLVLVASAVRFRLTPLYRLALQLPAPALRTIERIWRGWQGWLSAPPRVLGSMYHHALKGWDGRAVYPRIAVPTLVVMGARDRVFARSTLAGVADLIPGAESVDVGASGHMVMIERRDAFDRAVTRFVGATAPARPIPRSRPWLRHYDPGVPHTIGIPRRTVDRLLSSAARRFPRRPAIAFQGRTLTYAQLNRDADRLANALRALGVDRGDRVMLHLPNVPQTVIAYYAVLKAGAVVVFTSPTAEEDEIVRQVNDSGAKVLITLTRSGLVARSVKARTALQHVIFANYKDYLPWLRRLAFTVVSEEPSGHRLPFELGPGMHGFQALARRQPAQPLELNADPQDLAVLQYTGGTTATPKGVMLSHRNLMANTLQTRHWMPDVVEGREVFLSALPFSHIYGMTTALNVPVAVGAAMAIVPTFRIHEVLNAIRRYRPSYFPGVPAMYVAINNFPNARRYGIESIKWCISGAASLPVEVQEAFERLTHGHLAEGYGLTEAGPVTHANPLAGPGRAGSIGVPISSTEAKIVDLETGRRDVPPGQIGELVVRGPQVMMGYWNDPQATALAIRRGGWLFTGDIARMDAEGYFTLVARKQDLWYPERAGREPAPAFPRDVEEVLYEIPQVKEAVVVAIARQPIAFVISHLERPPAETLIAYCKRRLPPELVPRLIIFVDDFPRTFVGKVLRRELAKRVDASRLAPGE